VQLDLSHFQVLRLRPGLIPQMTPFHVTLSLAFIDLMVDIVTLAEIRNEIRFRPLKEAIFQIADNQIEVYSRLTNGETEWESDDEDAFGSDDDFDGQSDVGSDHSDTTDTGSEVENIHEEDIISLPTLPKDPRVLNGYIFPLDEFRLLSEKLKVHGDFRLKFDLCDGYLLIRTVPGLAHGVSAGYFSDELQSWAMVPNVTGLQKYTLRNSADSSMLLFIPLLH
jgi:hypothetical protein